MWTSLALTQQYVLYELRHFTSNIYSPLVSTKNLTCGPLSKIRSSFQNCIVIKLHVLVLKIQTLKFERKKKENKKESKRISVWVSLGLIPSFPLKRMLQRSLHASAGSMWISLQYKHVRFVGELYTYVTPSDPNRDYC